MRLKRLPPIVAVLVAACTTSSTTTGPASAANDRLHVSGLADGWEVGAMVDGRTAGGSEFVDAVHVGTAPDIDLGDVRSRDKVESVLVFARGTQPANAHPEWTDGEETVDVDLRGSIPIALHYWFVHDSMRTRLRALLGLVRSSSLLYFERSGVRLAIDGWDVFSTADRATIPKDYNCTFVEELAGGGFGPKDVRRYGYEPHAVNVYVLRSVLGSPHAGEWCEKKSPRAILLGYRGAHPLLAHELGHVFDLHHPDKEGADWKPGFDEKNVMASNSGGRRRHLAEGQTFRIHYSDDSYLNVLDWIRPSGGRLRAGEFFFIKRWAAGVDGQENDSDDYWFGDYPPPCWRVWPDGALPASSGAAAGCPHANAPAGAIDVPTMERVPPPPAPIPMEERFLRYDCLVGSRFEPRRDLVGLAAPNVQVFVAGARDGPPAAAIAEERAAATEAYREMQAWLALPVARASMPPALHREASRTTLADYVALVLEDFDAGWRVRSLQALALLRVNAAKPVVRGLVAHADPDVAAAAQAALLALH